MKTTMYALTLWQPWAWLVGSGAKRVENRPWKPPAAVYGQLIAIHAGMKDDADSRATITAAGVVIPEKLAYGAVIATARVVGIVRGKPDHPDISIKVVTRLYGPPMFDRENVKQWYFGPFGWLLDDIAAFEPVECRGFQRLWHLPPNIDVLVRARDHAARERRDFGVRSGA